ncbi:hypothetical protein [Desulfosporosinus sp. OT]|uniref:hypothetical protein n=1 Tax=Desulfosporosinus sp. OT TaxID=913865 RepID=UPI000590BCFB|nr:hypothetical protein [Desulfosporosinus sp. OT]
MDKSTQLKKRIRGFYEKQTECVQCQSRAIRSARIIIFVQNVVLNSKCLKPVSECTQSVRMAG